MYQTKCPACDAEGQLTVIDGTFSTNMPLCEDGFAFTDAKQIDTNDETVRCGRCDKLFMLCDLYRDGPDK